MSRLIVTHSMGLLRAPVDMDKDDFTLRLGQGGSIELRTEGERSQVVATLKADDARYIMIGRTGTHVLDRRHTDRFRLAAHWRGFCVTNAQRFLDRQGRG